MSKATLHCGDCLDVMRAMPDSSVDAVVTDPPYGLGRYKQEDVVACLAAWCSGQVYVPSGSGFMGKAWDAWVPGPEVWREVMRVLKPGGHALVFSGTRSVDVTGIALRIAGWEIRDSVAWVHGQGFPKNADVSKMIDKAAGAKREVVGSKIGLPGYHHRPSPASIYGNGNGLHDGVNARIAASTITAPATPAAEQWQGFGTALKPSFEPILLCRKPLSEKTIASNVLRWGTGALNVDGCRVAIADTENARENKRPNAWGGKIYGKFDADNAQWPKSPAGRWPPNLVHDGSDEVVGCFPVTKSGNLSPHHKLKASENNSMSGPNQERNPRNEFGNDTGSAARFFPSLSYDDEDLQAARIFYCAKASKRDRDEGCDGMEKRGNAEHDRRNQCKNGNALNGSGELANGTGLCNPKSNFHSTVKPTKLMRYLCRLITPPGGTILDPFTGSGSTGKAAMLEGFDFIGIEIDADYMAIAQARIEHAQKTTTPPMFRALEKDR